MEQENDLTTTDETINCFLSLYGISSYVNSTMLCAFKKEDMNYNKKFSKYCADLNPNKEEMDMKSQMKLRDKARVLLVKNDIIPFLSEYKIDIIINEMEKEIEISESIDSEFIDNLVND